MKDLSKLSLEDLLLHANSILKRMLEEIEEKEMIENIINNDHIDYLKKILKVLNIDEKYMNHFNKINESNYYYNFFTINRMCQVISKKYYSDETAKCFPYDENYKGVSIKMLCM